MQRRGRSSSRLLDGLRSVVVVEFLGLRGAGSRGFGFGTGRTLRSRGVFLFSLRGSLGRIVGRGIVDHGVLVMARAIRDPFLLYLG